MTSPEGTRRRLRKADLIGLGIGAFLVINVVFGMTYSIIDLHNEADEARAAQKVLLSLGTFAHSEATEMTLVILGGQTTTTGDQIERHFASRLARLPDLEGRTRLRSQIRQALVAYFDSVEEEARALAEVGDRSETPTTDIESDRLQLNTVLEGAATDYQDHAAGLDRTAEIELVVMMSLVIVIVGLLMRRAQRIREAAALQLEAQIRQSQKMEAVGQLAGGVAHDFNNLLTVILGNLWYLEQATPAEDPKQKDVAAVRKAAEEAQALTRQLLIYSRKQIVAPEVLDPNRVLVQFEKLIRRTLPASIDVTLRTAPDLKRVRIDPGQLEQVMMNLVVNARDAMPDGGRLLIETANITIQKSNADVHPELPLGSYVCITVSDTGQGIEEEMITRIFEPFFTSKPRGSGTGLGLATVYGIAKRFGGDVSVHSEPGTGSTFKVYLPVTDQTPDAQMKPEGVEHGLTEAG